MRRPSAPAGVAAAVLAAALLLAGCSGEDADQVNDAVDRAQDAASDAVERAEDVRLPEVDWDRFDADLQEQLDKAADAADCDTLADALTRYESEATDLTRYIEEKIEQAGC